VILISSDLPEVIGMSDRIGVMGGGTLRAILPAKSDPHVVDGGSARHRREGRRVKMKTDFSFAEFTGGAVPSPRMKPLSRA